MTVMMVAKASGVGRCGTVRWLWLAAAVMMAMVVVGPLRLL